MTRRLICVHGHFYQPPRENPWIEEVEVQDTAAPFHDWNSRIAAECYGPNTAARLKGEAGRISDIVNNYQHLSFNFGPTLLSWLEVHEKAIYQRILEADKESVKARGHGNAIAQGFNHAILPLCSPRDLRTQVAWGIADFKSRFQRDPEGFWLPETAADLATLQELADQGIRFTVLSPYQASRVRAPGGEWEDAIGARFDPTRPYLVKLARGQMAVFFYDGPIARSVAFGEALHNGGELTQRLLSGLDPKRGHDEVLTVAVDGETFGHHKKGGDEVLASALSSLLARDDVQLVNLGQALELCPPDHEAEIVEKSSWSCAHGVERWRSDCGCEANGQPGWRQSWRGPLRSALDQLRDFLGGIFEREGRSFFEDPWRARDEFVSVLLEADRKSSKTFLERHAGRPLEEKERVSALKLLEMQRQAMLMYTSCGWFFSELSGLETVQILKYAARALQLAREVTGIDLEPGFRQALEKAPSNLAELKNGANIFEAYVKPSVVSLEGVAAHYAIASLVEGFQSRNRTFCFELNLIDRRHEDAGTSALAMARVELRSLITQEKVDVTACVLHFSGADFRCGLRRHQASAYQETQKKLFAQFAKFSLADVVREIDREFPGRNYSLRDLFLDERREVANKLLNETMSRYESDYRNIYETNRRLIDFLREINSPVPRPLQVATDVALTHQAVDAAWALARKSVDFAVGASELSSLGKLARSLGARLELGPLRIPVARALDQLVEETLGNQPQAPARLCELVEIGDKLHLHLNLWHAQNSLWEAVKEGSCVLPEESIARLSRCLWLEEGALRPRPAGGVPARPAREGTLLAQTAAPL